MSAITQKKLLTAEEFFLLPDPEDGSQQGGSGAEPSTGEGV